MLRHVLFAGLSLSLAVASGAAESGIRFKLVNHGGYVLQKVFVSPAGSPGWGDDLLKGRSLRSGQSLNVHVKGGCGLYDVRLVTDAGVEYMDEDVNFCDDDDIVTVGKTAIKKSKPNGVTP